MKTFLILVIAICVLFITWTIYQHVESERKVRVESENAAEFAKLAERQNAAKRLLGR